MRLWGKKPAALIAAACPVTCGQQTTMLRDSFARICVRYQQEEDSNCPFICGGVWPKPGLRLIERREIEKTFTDTKEKIMPKKEGLCALCKKEKNLVTTYELKTCPSCGFLVRAVKLTPQLVIDEMRRQWGEKDFPAARAVQGEGEPGRAATDAMLARIITTYNLAPPTDVADFVDNLAREMEEQKRRAYSAEQVIETVRGLLDCRDDQSIIEVIAALERERKKATDIWFETLQILDADVACAAESLPTHARKIMTERHDYIFCFQTADRNLRKILDLLGKAPDADPVFELGLIMDEYYTMKALPSAEYSSEQTDNGPYTSLRRVLDLAYQQAANGKGKERHAKEGEPFEQQKICEIARRVGLGFPIGQAVKKAEESVGLGIDAGIRENLGAINYLAAAVIVMEEAAAGSGSFHVPV